MAKNSADVAIDLQVAEMRRLWPGFRCERDASGSATWRGQLLPAPWCDEYTVSVHYRSRTRTRRGGVKVTVISPELKVHDAQLKNLHLYGDRSLCLFNPNRHEWAPGNPLARTILPWTSEWLFFFQVWMHTGEWLGGGEHVNQNEDRK